MDLGNIAPVNRVNTTVSMGSANTEYSFTVTPRMRNLKLQLRSASVAFRYSWTIGEVAAGGGVQVGAGFGVVHEAPVAADTVLYFAAGSAGQTAEIEYERAV